MKSRLAVMFSEIASRATAFGEPVLGHLCRMAAIEAENASIPWGLPPQSNIACVWDWDVPNDLNRVDPMGAELLGVNARRANIDGLPNACYLKAVHPEDVETVSIGLQKAMEGGVFEARYRIVTSGQARWFLGRGFCTVDKSKRPERFAGALMALE
jgi:PAS fold